MALFIVIIAASTMRIFHMAGLVAGAPLGLFTYFRLQSGCEDKPTGMKVIFYLVTLVTIAVGASFVQRRIALF